MIIEKLLDLQRQEQESHMRAENEVYVTDLTRCAIKRYFEERYSVPPSTEAVVGKLLHNGFSSFVRQVEPEAQFEVSYKKEIDGVIIKGRVDVDLGPELWELKTGRDAPKDEPSEHHLLQCRIYLWLTDKALVRLIYITLNQFREFEIVDPCTDEEMRGLLKDRKSPMFTWECDYFDTLHGRSQEILAHSPFSAQGHICFSIHPSLLRDNLQWVCHSPVIPILRGFGIIFFQLEPTPPSSIRSLIR